MPIASEAIHTRLVSQQVKTYESDVITYKTDKSYFFSGHLQTAYCVVGDFSKIEIEFPAFLLGGARWEARFYRWFTAKVRFTGTRALQHVARSNYRSACRF